MNTFGRGRRTKIIRRASLLFEFSNCSTHRTWPMITGKFAPCLRLLDADMGGRRDSPCSVNCRAGTFGTLSC